MARILALTSRLPWPPSEGHQLRSWHLLRAMAREHEVTLLSFQRKDDGTVDDPAFRDLFHDVHVFPVPTERARLALAGALVRGGLGDTPFLVHKYGSPALRATLGRLARRADLVHFDMLPLFAHVDCVPAGVPVVLNAHNVEHRLLRKRVEVERHPLARRYLAGQVDRLRRFEARACQRADAVLACSDDDALHLRELAPDTSVTVVPNGVDLDANRPATGSPTGPSRMVFVGQMGWFPNRDGVDWFMRDVLPRIVATRPDAQFVVVGRSDGLEVPAGIEGHVQLAGFVPDLRPVVHDAAVYVVPLRAGSGTRLKVLEAMALGKAIVTTSVGSEGILLDDGISAIYADEPQAFANAVLELMEAPREASRLGAAARAQAERHYGWDAIGRDLLARYHQLLPRAA